MTVGSGERIGGRAIDLDMKGILGIDTIADNESRPVASGIVKDNDEAGPFDDADGDGVPNIFDEDPLDPEVGSPFLPFDPEDLPK